jgi:hypothetical protein
VDGKHTVLIYLVLYAGFALAAATEPRDPSFRKAVVQPLSGRWLLAFSALLLLIGFRHEVGADWSAYEESVAEQFNEPFLAVGKTGDPAYSLLNWIGANIGGGIYLVNLVCAGLFSWGLITFSRHQTRPWLAIAVATPYLITVVAMGYTRQGVAIGLAMVAMTALQQGSIFRFLLWLFAAALFHKTAVILAPFAILVGSHRWYISVPTVGLAAGIMFVLLLQEAADGLVQGYILAEYESAGAAIRVTMNATPAAIFLLLRSRFGLSTIQRRFWTWMALGGIAFVGLLWVSPSSTAVDRVALYWIPLQLFVFSRLPDVVGRPGRRNTGWVWIVLAYSQAVLLVWLLFATHSFAWLPYRFYLWELLWR